ncbi:hypothetical protein AHOG_10555 [Actinoalloteichus hoggarensis]|uniref:Uncharacterized protein n=1 Tax=Actinoalloteichus hoggarensis TaxID=1470176 RepID=A0A221W1R9_9PSEU|nr:hypothetical protein AHOG_10555 [Actinoalloteichus hoggarensis]
MQRADRPRRMPLSGVGGSDARRRSDAGSGTRRRREPTAGAPEHTGRPVTHAHRRVPAARQEARSPSSASLGTTGATPSIQEAGDPVVGITMTVCTPRSA